jgi:hypothetical protein
LLPLSATRFPSRPARTRASRTHTGIARTGIPAVPRPCSSIVAHTSGTSTSATPLEPSWRLHPPGLVDAHLLRGRSEREGRGGWGCRGSILTPENNAPMAEAIFGLAGVLLGGLLTLGTDLYKRRQEAHAEFRAAARVVLRELDMTERLANAFVVNNASCGGTPSPVVVASARGCAGSTDHGP